MTEEEKQTQFRKRFDCTCYDGISKCEGVYHVCTCSVINRAYWLEDDIPCRANSHHCTCLINNYDLYQQGNKCIAKVHVCVCEYTMKTCLAKRHTCVCYLSKKICLASHKQHSKCPRFFICM